MAEKRKCIGNGVNIRTGPGMSYNTTGSMLYKGDIVDTYEHSNGWYKHSRGGWSSAKYLELYQQEPSVAVNPPVQTVTAAANQESVAYGQKEEADLDELKDVTKYSSFEDEPPELLDMVSTDKEYLNNIKDDLRTSTLRGIHGMPYQFLPIVDNRIDNKSDSFGRKYSEKIVARMPLLLITPGEPKFMASYSQSDRSTILENFTRIASKSSIESSLDGLLNKDGRFYSFKPNYTSYYDYVNTMCRAVAHYMGIEDEKVNGKKLGSFDWYEDIESDLSKVIRSTKAVAFYIDSDKQISENYSNDTGNSMLKDQINGLSDSARELQFLLGGTSYLAKNGKLANFADRMFANGESNTQTTSDFVDTILGKGNGGIFSRITSNIQTLVGGGKLIFPEIWTDSSAGGDSYDVTIKLHCPNPTPFGLYMDIMAPIIHCICLAAPRYATANGYFSPFLVRCFYKGMFNVDMGIITSLSISKGAEGSWSREGIPTCAEINMTIKDLYKSFMISKQETIMNNIGLLDYMANMCGINPNEIDVNRQIELYLAFNSFTRMRDLLRYDIFRGLEQWKDTVKYDIYSRLFR